MYLSRDEVRAIDRRAIEEYGVPGVVLMENAGRGAVDVLMALGVTGTVTICCGKGNNGGDGFVMARHLDIRHVPVHVLLFARPEELQGDAAINHRIVERSRLPLAVYRDACFSDTELAARLTASSWVVDALFGTGLTGAVRPPFDRVIAAINASTAHVVAVDIPSGLDCETGQPLGPTVRAAHTVTFVARKKGFAAPAAAEWLGAVHVVDIGAPRALIDTCGGVP